jgi:GDP-D-mannose dehydratase
VSDPSKATKLLDWTPEVSFEELVQMMVDSDLRLLQIEDK